jgi:CheY-like chemotaxis protein
MPASVRILVVDDQRRARQSLKALLASNFKAIELFEAESGPEAIRLATECRPLVVIIDAHMSGLDGLEITRHLKADLPQAHIIALSLYPEYEASALAAGAEAFVSKVDPPERLLAAVAAAAGRGDRPQAKEAGSH